MNADEANYFFSRVKGIQCNVVRGREELRGSFLQVFQRVSNLRIKGLKITPHFIAKRPLLTKPLFLRFSLNNDSEQTFGAQFILLGITWWTTLRSAMSLWFWTRQVCSLVPSKALL